MGFQISPHRPTLAANNTIILINKHNTFYGFSSLLIHRFLFLDVKETFFTFNNIPCTQTEGVILDSLLGPSLSHANILLCHHETGESYRTFPAIP